MSVPSIAAVDSDRKAVAATWLRMFALGATVGSALDGLHTHAGATAYAQPWWWRMAWWTPLLFGGAYAALGRTWRLLEARGRVSSPPAARRAMAFVAFAGLYASSAYLPVSSGAELALLLAGGTALLLALGPSLGAFGVAVAAAIGGPLTEIGLVRLGAFAYLRPDVQGISLWLPGLYFASAAAAPFIAWVGEA
jgi:hypothetical protein